MVTRSCCGPNSGAPALIQPAIGWGGSWNVSLKKAFSYQCLVKGETSMKSLVAILAVAVAVAFTAPAFAGPGSTITNKEDCEKAGKVWDDAGKKCVEKQ
jgi:hypothetical protein